MTVMTGKCTIVFEGSVRMEPMKITAFLSAVVLCQIRIWLLIGNRLALSHC